MRWALLTQARVTAKALDVKGASKETLIASLKAQAKIYPKLKVTWQVKDVKANSFDLYMKASEPKKVVDDFTPGKVYRADDFYKSGDIGIKLGGKADIMTPWEHVRRPSKGETSLFTSFSELRGKVLKFTKKGKVYSIDFEDLKRLEFEGLIKIHTPNSVKQMMLNSANKRLLKDANNVFEIMNKNKEILIEGLIPQSTIK
ncbi:hypothetical protein BWK58_14200 [Flavobacterium columnare]|nr:hypothetical protein BWK58_14200 [Flavobacterium columnare]